LRLRAAITEAQSIFLDAERTGRNVGTKVKDNLYFSQVAELDAGGEKKAIREARRAVDLADCQDSLQGPGSVFTLRWFTRDRRARRAIEQLEIIATIRLARHTAISASIHAGFLRGDKRFDKIVAAAKRQQIACRAVALRRRVVGRKSRLSCCGGGP